MCNLPLVWWSQLMSSREISLIKQSFSAVWIGEREHKPPAQDCHSFWPWCLHQEQKGKASPPPSQHAERSCGKAEWSVRKCASLWWLSVRIYPPVIGWQISQTSEELQGGAATNNVAQTSDIYNLYSLYLLTRWQYFKICRSIKKLFNQLMTKIFIVYFQLLWKNALFRIGSCLLFIYIVNLKFLYCVAADIASLCRCVWLLLQRSVFYIC